MAANKIDILIIEDNPDDTDLLEIMLGESQSPLFEVKTVARVKSALELLEQDDYDAILLDLSLPDSQGVETFLNIHDKVVNTPVLVLTGLSDEKLALDLVFKGAQDYLVKGQLDSKLLIRSIRYAIERNQLQIELNKAREVESEAQKLRVANQLAGTIAHEFNNPLAIIKGNVDLLMMINKDDNSRELAGKISQQIERMRKLVDKLLAIEELRELDYAEELKIYDIHLNPEEETEK